MTIVTLTEDEISDMRSLLGKVVKEFHSTEDLEFLDKAPLLAHELPARVRETLLDFKYKEPVSALCIVSGFPIDDSKVGATPAHWKDRKQPSPALEEEMLLVLLGSLLGDCLAWATQQKGYFVHDLLPIKGTEQEQMGSSSDGLLWWHVEDAFHPYRGDYIGLSCLRNHSRVATTFASLENIQLDPKHRELLFEPHFTIRPDKTHLQKTDRQGEKLVHDIGAAYADMERRDTEPDKISVFFGDPEAPYLRIDPFFMGPAESPDAQEALDSLIQSIESNLQDLVFKPGDFCFVDNYRAVHGRKPFKARYDGTDRWLKRINITRDLRKSRASQRTRRTIWS